MTCTVRLSEHPWEQQGCLGFSSDLEAISRFGAFELDDGRADESRNNAPHEAAAHAII
jgi:hypothetical protein